IIAAETGTSITLRRQDGEEDVLLRGDIDALVGTGQSLMPEGLERDLTPRDVADLVALLSASGPPRKEFEGNRREIVWSDAQGRIVLPASAAEIYGDQVVFEPKYRNIGYWFSEKDHAVWRLTVPGPGPYDVWLDWACDAQSAGNRFVLIAGESRL